MENKKDVTIYEVNPLQNLDPETVQKLADGLSQETQNLIQKIYDSSVNAVSGFYAVLEHFIESPEYKKLTADLAFLADTFPVAEDVDENNPVVRVIRIPPGCSVLVERDQVVFLDRSKGFDNG